MTYVSSQCKKKLYETGIVLYAARFEDKLQDRKITSRYLFKFLNVPNSNLMVYQETASGCTTNQ